MAARTDKRIMPQEGSTCYVCGTRYRKTAGPYERAVYRCAPTCRLDRRRARSLHGEWRPSRSPTHSMLLPNDRGCDREPKTTPPSFGEPRAGVCVTIPGLMKPGCGGQERLDTSVSLAFNGARQCFRCLKCGRDRWVLVAPLRDESLALMRYQRRPDQARAS